MLASLLSFMSLLCEQSTFIKKKSGKLKTFFKILWVGAIVFFFFVQSVYAEIQ